MFNVRNDYKFLGFQNKSTTEFSFGHVERSFENHVKKLHRSSDKDYTKLKQVLFSSKNSRGHEEFIFETFGDSFRTQAPN